MRSNKSSNKSDQDFSKEIEETIKDLEQAYKELDKAEKDKKSKEVDRQRKKIIKMIVGLMNAGYSDETIREALMKAGFRYKDIDELMTEAWRSDTGSSVGKLFGFFVAGSIVAILIAFVVFIVILQSTVGFKSCSSPGCLAEIESCSPGKYLIDGGDMNLTLTLIISRVGASRCHLSFNISNASDQNLIGEEMDCDFDRNASFNPINDCNGSLAIYPVLVFFQTKI